MTTIFGEMLSRWERARDSGMAADRIGFRLNKNGMARYLAESSCFPGAAHLLKSIKIDFDLNQREDVEVFETTEYLN